MSTSTARKEQVPMSTVVSASARRAQLREQSRKRTRSRLLIATICLLVAATLGWAVLFTSVLGVRSVRVTGAHGVSAGAIEQVAAVVAGTPLARVDTAAVAARVGQIPQLETVSVGRALPGTVTVTVVERRPVAVVDADGGRWLVDRHGVLFDQVTEVPAGLPPLQLKSPGPGDAATVAAVTVLGSLPDTLAGQVSLVAAKTADSVVLTLADGRTVVWGGAADSATKARVLAGLIGRPGTTFDISSPAAVVIR